ncbi:hypothetical protein K7640_22205 [Micromonospora sp. PLK6-60]|uniref:hypothetical protein n=1 Tax=Micromonospora sp. PLK6-60 TaxID=2873383 RepID=UPI001CA6BD25|nr:hypothetical protein [Micromonospora sp. PLK6-60]MBY8874544.1 hypothetical protein [Micromonospora sp. PLK6-60]
MRHPSDGTLRRLVDEPAGVPDVDRAHVAACPGCLSGLAAAQRDATLTGAALDVELSTDVAAGWHRLAGTLAADGRRHPATARPARRWRTALRSPVIAAVAAVAVLAGASAAAAANWLEIFRTERVAPVTFSQADLVELPDLSAYGTVEVTHRPQLREANGPAAARQATGLPLPQVGKLPRGVTGAPTYRVGDRMEAVFTFSAEQAARTAAAAGEPLPPPPAGLDGSRFRLVAGPGLAAVWSEARGVPALIVARAVAPTAYSSGTPFQTARDYLLSLPGLPADVAAQLRHFSADGATLPLPVAADQLSSRPVDVGGVPATLLTARDGSMAGVVWAHDGQLTAVAGSISADEVLSVARELRWTR